MTLCHILPERRGWVNMINQIGRWNNAHWRFHNQTREFWMLFLLIGVNWLSSSATDSVFTIIYIYIYIYIYCHQEIDCFVVSQIFSADRPVRCFKLSSKRGWFYFSQISYSRAIFILNVREGIFYDKLFTCWLSATGQLNSWEELLHFSVYGSRQFPNSTAKPTVGASLSVSLSLYIYIYIYNQSLCTSRLRYKVSL